ncbi:hypothetical protein T10_13603 [Trichinella papuae]|uniref:Uncharacterized protein n=1 Tax=Trichinella papuae TaxID=268474 RepID=A0A0V1N922_9BILA|nr:hypothetical protein T10_13603 [Trichinella papuae]
MSHQLVMSFQGRLVACSMLLLQSGKNTRVHCHLLNQSTHTNINESCSVCLYLFKYQEIYKHEEDVACDKNFCDTNGQFEDET